MTLSWFWTFTSQPDFTFIQWSHNWNFFIYCNSNWWSASFTAGKIYPVTISWTTATLGGANTVPTISSYTLRQLFANWTNIFAFYSLTSSPYTADVGRKWNGSTWSTLSWAALPTSLGVVQTQSYINNWSYQGIFSTLPIWTTTKYWYTIFDTSKHSLRFNLTTEVWSLSWFTYGNFVWDPSWLVIWSNKIQLKDDTSIPWPQQIINFYNVNDIENWLLSTWYNTWNYYYSWCVAWLNKRFRKIVAYSANANYFALFSLDWWATWNSVIYISTLITNWYNFNYTGNLICYVFYSWQYNWPMAEIVS